MVAEISVLVDGYHTHSSRTVLNQLFYVAIHQISQPSETVHSILNDYVMKIRIFFGQKKMYTRRK